MWPGWLRHGRLAAGPMKDPRSRAVAPDEPVEHLSLTTSPLSSPSPLPFNGWDLLHNHWKAWTTGPTDQEHLHGWSLPLTTCLPVLNQAVISRSEAGGETEVSLFHTWLCHRSSSHVIVWTVYRLWWCFFFFLILKGHRYINSTHFSVLKSSR